MEGGGLTLEEIERLPSEEFEALPEGLKAAVFRLHGPREFPVPGGVLRRW